MAISVQLQERIEELREELLDLFASQRGVLIERWWITRRNIKTLLAGIVEESPREHSECDTWRGPNGERCGCFRGKWKPRRRKARGKKNKFRKGYYYPRIRLRLPGNDYQVFKGGKKYRLSVQVQAARALLALKHGVMPSNMVAGHTCPCGENELCLNIAHLAIMTPLENFLRIRLNGHVDSHTLGMIEAVVSKFAACPESMTEQELRLFVAVQSRALEVTPEGEVLTHNLVEEASKQQGERVPEPGEIPF